MRNAIIVHGKPSREEYYDPAVPPPSSHHWLPWLAKQLLVRAIHAVRPEMPHAYAPDYPSWRREFERYDVEALVALLRPVEERYGLSVAVYRPAIVTLGMVGYTKVAVRHRLLEAIAAGRRECESALGGGDGLIIRTPLIEME